MKQSVKKSAKKVVKAKVIAKAVKSVSAAAQSPKLSKPKFETKHYADGSSATGVAPLPPLSPDEQRIAEMKAATPSAKFRVGQIVRILTKYYNSRALRKERYQQITQVWDWDNHAVSTPAFGYRFLNGDRCNEKWIVALTKKERGE